MKVAQVIDSLKIGGAQKLQVTFASAAKSRALEVIVICLQESDGSPFAGDLSNMGVQVISLPAKKALSIKRLRRMRDIFREQRIDIVHTHLTTANITGVLAAALAGIPSVATLHTAGIDPRFHHPGRRALETVLLRFAASRVVGVGRAVLEANKKRLGNKHIEVIPNAVTPIPPADRLERARLRSMITGEAKRPLLISVGRISPPKAYPDLMEAIALLRKQQPEVALAIVGDGVGRAELEQKIAELHLSDSVFLLGARSDVPQLLQAADLYVCSSRWEGLPVSVLEAMAAGLPIVSTAVGSIPDVVPQNAGRLVPPADPSALSDALSFMLQHPAQMKVMGIAARGNVDANFGPDVWLDRWISLYSEICHPRHNWKVA